MPRIATGDAQARLRQMVESRLTGVSASDRPAALEEIAREAKTLGVEPAVLRRIVDAFDRGRELVRGAELAAFAQHGSADVQRSRPLSGSPQWLVKGGVDIPGSASKQVAATGASAVKEVGVDDFQRLTGLVVLDCGSAYGVVDSGDNIFETGSAVFSSEAISAVLAARNPDGTPRYSQAEILNTLTAFILGVVAETDTDLSALGEAERELIGMALQHAGLDPEMGQLQYDQELLRFVTACPPNDALLGDLKDALLDQGTRER